MSGLEVSGRSTLRIARLGTIRLASSAGVADLRREFDRHHCVRLPAVIDPSLLEWLLDEIDRADFVERVHARIGPNRELCMSPGRAHAVLHLLFNSEVLFETVREITGCGPIGNFSGRVYRVVPGLGHHDAWHDDVDDHRLAAMSLNLSREAFSGGSLQIRMRATRQVVHEVTNTGLGDALLFRLSPDLQHRITDMRGTTAKTAFAGWFRSRPRFGSWFGVRPPGDAS